MKRQNKQIISIALVIFALVLILIYINSEWFFPIKAIPKLSTDYSWKDMGDGSWKRTDLKCGSACISNCYESPSLCIKNSPKVENFLTSMGNEVFCLPEGCTFEDCNIVCIVE
jgi:hypothetical protein